MADENDTARFKLLDKIPVIYKDVTCYVHLYITSSSMTVECPWPVSNSVKRFFKMNNHKSKQLAKVDFAYTHKDSNNCECYQVVEWTNWPRRLKKYIAALGLIELVTKVKLYYITIEMMVRSFSIQTRMKKFFTRNLSYTRRFFL